MINFKHYDRKKKLKPINNNNMCMIITLVIVLHECGDSRTQSFLPIFLLKEAIKTLHNDTWKYETNH